jgi:hypothetical protein
MAIPKTYFRHVNPSNWLGVPLAFGLLPMAGFCPSTLECIFPAAVMTFILANQVNILQFYKSQYNVYNIFKIFELLTIYIFKH